jgi:TolB-like protein/thioredoxin-like negative regulator of GroEL
VRADAVGNANSYFGQLIGELQRRRVLRTAALYIVGAWLALQVADVVFPALGISEKALRFVLFGAVLGFPVALVFGWFYDIGTHGIRRTKAADVDASGGAQTLRRTDYVILTALGAVVVAILYNAIGSVVEAPRDRWEQDRDRPPMLAVLPFVATNAAGESESFAAGVHDDLLTQLSKIQSIRVISRTSVMGYKDTVRNVREIGKELGADTILEGGVQSAGNKIRINAQLIDARTDEHLWAQTYDRELTLANIFEVQAEIARAITSAMRATLTEKDEDDLTAIPTENLAAYRTYHQAIQLRGKHGRTEDVIAMLEEVTALDPMFTRAWAELVGSVSLLTFGKTEQEPERVRQAEEALEHIRSIAPESSDYIIAQAYYTYYTLRDYDRALQLILRAQEMVPSDAHLFGIASWIQRRQGDVDGQIESLRRALELDPQDRGRVEGLVHALMISHHYDEAQSVLESTDIEEYYLSYLSSMLRVKEHRDFDLWAQDVARLVTEFEGTDDFYSYDLWETSIATRNFKAAEKFLSQMPGHADDPNPYHQYGTKLRNSIYTFFFLRKQEELAIAASQLRSIIDGGRDPNGDFDRARAALDLALIEAVEGNYDEALRLVRHWRRLASDDLAELLRGRSQACSIFGIVGASKEAVECLRNAFEEPSFALPFIDPFYPHYDSIRDQPEFVELLAEIDGEM